jgi:hypothetical protein
MKPRIITLASLTLLASLVYCSSTILHINSTFGPTPKYCIDDKVLVLFKERYSNCLEGGSALQELKRLKKISLTDFTRSHELLAHKYFVEDDNPYRVPCSEAELEYVPLLPVSWRNGTHNELLHLNILIIIVKSYNISLYLSLYLYFDL